MNPLFDLRTSNMRLLLTSKVKTNLPSSSNQKLYHSQAFTYNRNFTPEKIDEMVLIKQKTKRSTMKAANTDDIRAKDTQNFERDVKERGLDNSKGNIFYI